MSTTIQKFAKNALKKLMFCIDMCWHAFEKLITLLGGRTIAMLAVALLITMVSVLYNDNWILSIGRQDAVINQVKTNILTLQKLKTNLYKAESAQRGYLLTKREDYIEPFDTSLHAARENIDKIEKLMSSTSFGNAQIEQREWLKAISASLEAKAAEMKMTLNMSRAGKPLIARQIMSLDEGLIEMMKFMEHTDIVIQNQNNVLAAKTQTKQRTVLIARISIYASALILIGLVILVIKQLLAEIVIKSHLQQRVSKENTIYEEKLQQQTKLLHSLALDYQADVERERHKLSRELHDELGSIFTATKMDIAWVVKKMKDVAPEVAEEIITKLRKTIGYVDQGIQYQRHIVQELHPAMLTTFGFWPALNSLIQDAAERNQWELNLNLPDENTKLDETLSLVIYRIVQETLNNANKYANASKISVDVMVDAQYIKVEIEDDGIGIDMHAIEGNTHGLSGMRHRVLAIGGHFEILSELGKGVTTRALIPLNFEA